MTAEFASERKVAADAVRQAARVCRAVQQELIGSVLEKADRSPVTVADFASQALVCRALQQAFPDDPVVAEESADELRTAANAGVAAKVLAQVAAEPSFAGVDADAVFSWIDHGGGAPGKRFWTLDPIDGTKGFLRGEQYAIALGLIVDGQVVVGALCCPNLPVDFEQPEGPRGVVFSAVRGHGCTVAPLDGGGPAVPARVATSANPGDVRVCESVESGHSSHDRSAKVAAAAGFTAEPLRIDSQAKYAVVARGDAGVYWRFARGDYREKIWDHAGGCLVCTEAGGRVTDLEGRDLDFSQGRQLENNRGVIVSNGALHEAVLAAVRSVDSED